MNWNYEDLYLKAKVYIDRANENEHSSSQFPFWSALALELLARASLAKIHPVLNADPKELNNILHALGYDTTGSPRSIPVHAVYLRLEKVLPNYGREHRALCDYMAVLRNEEIHTGGVPFEDLKESSWLPRFYEVCKILCTHLGYQLDAFLGAELAESADELIKTLNQEILSKVKNKIQKHATEFRTNSQEEQERNELRETLARTQLLGITKSLTDAIAQQCPACESDGIMRGNLIRELQPKYVDEALYVDEEYLAAEFECLVCGLSLSSLEEIIHGDLEPRFSKTREADLHELFQLESYDDYMNM